MTKDVSIITMLYPSNIKGVWAEIEPMVSETLSLYNTHTPEDVRKVLLSGQAQLWVQWTKDVDAFMVTEFINYPKGVWLRIWLMAAKKDKEILWDKMKAEITNFANANNCAGIEVIGREGWGSKFKEAEKHSVIFRLPLNEKVH